MSTDFHLDVDPEILMCLASGEVVALDVNGEPTWVRWCLYGKDENTEHLVVIMSDYTLGRLHATVRELPRKELAVDELDWNSWVKLEEEVEREVKKYWFGWETEPPDFEGIVQTIIRTLKKEPPSRQR